MRAIRLFAGLPLLFGIVACGDESNPDPTLTSLEPNAVSTRVATPAVLSGQNFFAAVRSSLDNNDPPAVDGTWTVTMAGVELPASAVVLRDRESFDIEIPADLPPGVHSVTIVSPTGKTATLIDGLTVIDDADLELAIHDLPGPNGSPIGKTVLLIDQTLRLHAVTRRRSNGRFAFSVEVDWQIIQGQSGSLDDVISVRTTFAATSLGTAVVSAQHAIYGTASTGDLIVGVCLDATGCADPCRSGNTCVDGACIVGAVDKDSDSDGFIDSACPGGDDCDDDPMACGNGCFPGALDICDGVNQDCDAMLDEDPQMVWFEDADGDLFGNANSTLNACLQPAGYVDDNQDCADVSGSDPDCAGQDGSMCNPNATEGPEGDVNCSDGADNDCDGDIDGLDADCCPTACTGCGSTCCRDFCSGGDCNFSCNNSSCPCNLDCGGTAGTCTTSCSGLTTCNIDCSGTNNCRNTCSGALCIYDCTDNANNCEIDCDSGANCDIDCTDANNCDTVTCTTGSQCVMDCTDANNCDFETCSGGQSSCPGDVIVCNRPCP